MEDRCFYLSVSGMLSKALLRASFIDELRMEFIGDSVYQIEIFACSSTLFDTEESAILYFQCENIVGSDLLKQFVRTLLTNDDSMVICLPSNYCCDGVSKKGLIVWHV